MSRLHLLILWIIALGAGIYYFKTRDFEPQLAASTDLEAGSNLIGDELVENATELSVEMNGESTTIKISDNQWVIAEENNFPADRSDLAMTFRTLRDSKIIQGVPAEPEYLDRFHLDPENEDKNKRPIIVSLKDGGEETVKVFVGKSRQATGGGGPTAGTFVRIDGDDSGVYVIRDSFSFLTAKPLDWIDQTLKPLEEGAIKVEVTPVGEDADLPWVVSRKTVMDDFILEGIEENQETNVAETGLLKNTLTEARFVELLTPEEAKERSAAEGIRKVKITDSAGSVFLVTLTPEKKKEEEKPDPKNPAAAPMAASNFLLTIEILEGPKDPAPLAEDATDQDRAVYQQRRANKGDIEKKIEQLKKVYAGRTFLFNKAPIGGFLKKRSELISAKKPEPKKPTSVTSPPIQVPRPTTPIPLRPPAEVTTPPVQVPPQKPKPTPTEAPDLNRNTPPPNPGTSPEKPKENPLTPPPPPEKPAEEPVEEAADPAEGEPDAPDPSDPVEATDPE